MIQEWINGSTVVQETQGQLIHVECHANVLLLVKGMGIVAGMISTSNVWIKHFREALPSITNCFFYQAIHGETRL